MTDGNTSSSAAPVDNGHLSKMFIGTSLFNLIKTHGPPLGHIKIQDNDALLFTYRGHCVACEFSGGECVTAYDTGQLSCSERVLPERPKQVFIRRYCGNLGGRMTGTMQDVSLSAMRINLAGHDPDFMEQEQIYCCTVIRTHQQTQIHVGLYALVKQWNPESKELEIVFGIPFETHSYRALTNYVITRLAQRLFSGSELEHYSGDSPNGDDTAQSANAPSIIRSDLCLTCPVCMCGNTYNIFNDTGKKYIDT